MAEIKHTDDPMSLLPHVSNSRFRQAIKKYFYKDIEPEYTQYIENLIINGSIESLDTLKELAEAIGNDPNFFGDVNARFDAVEETVEENEEVTSAALNDLNDRINGIVIPVVPTTSTTLIEDDPNPVSGGAVYDVVVENERVTSSALNDLNTRIDETNQDISGKEDVVTIEAPVNATDATQPITSLTCVLNKYYRIDVPIETLSITLPSMTNVTTIKTVTLFLTGGTAPDPQFASADTGVNVYFADGFEVQSGSTYEISCLWNGAAWIVASVTIITTP